MKNAINSVVNGPITVKFCTGITHDKAILQTQQNSEICTDVVDHGVILLKFELFVEKHSNLESSISVFCG